MEAFLFKYNEVLLSANYTVDAILFFMVTTIFLHQSKKPSFLLLLSFVDDIAVSGALMSSVFITNLSSESILLLSILF